MAFHCLYTTKATDIPSSICEEIVDYDSKPSDYDSIILKKYQLFAECKSLNIPRHLSEEVTYTVYKSETHPPETFRLEQFGLPDVAERSRGISRTSIALIAAGVVIGVLLLVTWLRGRRRARTA